MKGKIIENKGEMKRKEGGDIDVEEDMKVL